METPIASTRVWHDGKAYAVSTIDRRVSRHWWVISAATYGEFAFFGTEQEAEEIRAHKSSWEGTTGKKKRVRATHKKVRKHMKWVLDYEIPKGYPRSSEREQAETAAILAANKSYPARCR